jgi:hypothetical protein
MYSHAVDRPARSNGTKLFGAYGMLHGNAENWGLFKKMIFPSKLSPSLC